jgi:hypothetical protein
MTKNTRKNTKTQLTLGVVHGDSVESRARTQKRRDASRGSLLGFGPRAENREPAVRLRKIIYN